MAAAESSSGERDSDRADVEVSISIRTVLLVGAAVAIASALVSISNVLLVILVSSFGVGVLSPVATAMEQRLGWSRGLCATVLVLITLIVIVVLVLVLAHAISGAVRGFSHDLPHILNKVRHSDLGKFINSGSNVLETLRRHANDITKGVGKASGGIAHVGTSAAGAVALFFSIIFLTLFGLIEEPRARDWTGSMLYRDDRKRYLQVTDRVINATSRYMLGNLAISVICGTVYGVAAVNPRRSVPARPRCDCRDPRPHPERRSHDRRRYRWARRAVGQP